MNVRRSLMLVACAGVLGVGLAAALAASSRSTEYALLDPIVDVQHLVTTHFVRDLSDDDLKAMQQGAIRGLLEPLEDPYTEFIPAADEASFDKEIRGEYAGIGAQVDTKDGWLRIVSPMEDTPAFRAGVEADDLIIAVNGQSTYRLSVDAVIERLTGAAGSNVTITIEREGGGVARSLPASAAPPTIPDADGEAPGPRPGASRFDLTLVREKIIASTVKGLYRVGDKWAYMIDPQRKVAYVRVTQFTPGTVPELEAACRQIVDEGVQGLILDLRFNGGGSLFAAIQMADLFLKNELIVSTKGRSAGEERVFAKEPGTLPDFPMMVVLNESSASASEVVAGALADNGRAMVLGTRSFGKGIVQALYRLPSGAGQLKITEQNYYLPSGRSIQRRDESTSWGVDPSPGFYVPMSNDEYREMLRVRREDEIIRPQNNAAPQAEARWSDPEWILEHLKDMQLSAAVRALRARLESGQWTPAGDAAPQATLQLAELSREQRRYELLARELARTERRISALEEGAGAQPSAVAILPEGVDPTGGRLQITGADGKTLATLAITGSDLAAWLSGAPVKAIDPSEPDGADARQD